MKNVPKLRFSGFSDEWKEDTIGNITSKVGSGKTPKGGNTVYTTEGVPFIRSQNVLNGQLILDDIAYISEEENEKMKSTKVQPNDVLLNITGASIGRACIVPNNFEGANLNQHVCIIRTNKANPRFIMDYIISNRIQKQIFSYQAGGNREGLNFEQIKGMKIGIPSNQEQEKIANFLTKIDKLIEKQDEKVNNLEQYKKGMMQKIFSQEIRFKKDDGGEYPEWERKHLKDIVINKAKGGLPQYSEDTANILLNNEYLEGINTVPIYVTNEINVAENDVLILWDGSQSGKVYTGAVGVLGSTFVSIKLNSDNNNMYIYQLLNSRKDLIQTVWREGSGVPHVAKDFIENFKVSLPCLDEQSKIANFLSKIDLIVEKETEKLEELREWKKGLLQGMFV